MCKGFSVTRDCRLRKEGVQLVRDLILCFKRHSHNELEDPVLQSVTCLFTNIANGFAQLSGENFTQFLLFAKGSCAEIQRRVDWAMANNIISPAEGADFSKRLRRLSGMLFVLITSQPADPQASMC